MNLRLLPLIVFAMTAFAAGAAAQSLLVVAGGGSDDGRPATAIGLSAPSAVAVDAGGNLYVADTASHRIRKIAPDRIITTIAGNGSTGRNGDGGPATAAQLQTPRRVAVDSAGNVYIPNESLGIRKIDISTGIISTVAGGHGGFGGDGGPATAAAFNLQLNPGSGLALDRAGNLYIADTGNRRVRRVDAATGVVTTVAGNGIRESSGDGGMATAASFSFPIDVAVDGEGNLFVVDGGTVRRVTATTGIISSVYSGSAHALAVDSTGVLYISERVPGRILKMTLSGDISTVAGGGSDSGDHIRAVDAQLQLPEGIAVDSRGGLYIAETGTHSIRYVDPDTGIIATVAGNRSYGFTGDGGPATSADLSNPEALTFDRDGNLYVAEASVLPRIRKIAASTGVITTIAGNGSLDRPSDIAVDRDGNLYVAEQSSNRIQKIAAATGMVSVIAGKGSKGFSGDGGAATEAELDEPLGVALDTAGNLYIADARNSRIRKVALDTGVITTIAGNGTATFSGDGGAATAAGVSFPLCITVDSAGNLYICTDKRIRKVTAANGIITTVAGGEGLGGDGGPATEAFLTYPSDVAVDRAGNLYIADTFSNRFRRVDAATGTITTIVGPGDGAFLSGVGGPATAASPGYPRSIAVDTLQNLFMTGFYTDRVLALFACATVPRPELELPSNGALDSDASITFAWKPSRGAFTYDLYLGRNEPLPIAASNLKTNRHSVSNLEPGATYYWRIAAKGDPFCPAPSNTFSETRSFTTGDDGCAPPSFNSAD